MLIMLIKYEGIGELMKNKRLKMNKRRKEGIIRKREKEKEKMP